ncbi:MAG: hypothetical protein WD225_03445 [Ilumatobacteraceae bacterium]
MLERLRGSAAEFHARTFPDPPRPAVWWFEVDRPAVVLGSRQPVEVLDRAACEREGLEVARRRSGGGIVLLVPGEVTWVDVLVPTGGEGWSDDLRDAMCWLGERWTAALAAVGVESGVTVHRGGLEGGAWGELVCFGGIGPGEVLLDGRKLIGISQRRTRAGARFQCALHHRYDGDRTVGLLAATRPTGPLPPVGVLPGLDARTLVGALVDALGRSAPA